jgi:hypothetical protein
MLPAVFEFTAHKRTKIGVRTSQIAVSRATGDVAASSQDAQKQMQGQPTAAEQAQGAQPSAKMAD